MTLQEWEPIARRLFGAFPHAQVSPETVLVYFESLQEYDVDIVGWCALQCLEGSDFLPTIRKLLERIEPEQEARDYQRLYALGGDVASELIERTEKMRIEGVPIRQAVRTAGFREDLRALPLPGERKELPA